MTTLRLIDTQTTASRTNGQPVLIAKTYRDAGQNAYLVRFIRDGRLHPAADYETDDKIDAIGTALAEIARADRRNF